MSSQALVMPRPVTPAAGRSVVRTLTRIEVRRLVRQPVFVVAVLLFAVVAGTSPFSEYANAEFDLSKNGSETNLDWPVLPSFLMGLGGLLAMNRIAKGSSRAGDVLLASPASAFQRTLALCLTCLVPACVGLVGSVYMYAFWLLDPPVQAVGWFEFSSAEHASIMTQGVLASFGGPLLGVAVARWWRWPTAGAITAVGLVLWSVLSAVVLDDTVWERLVHQSAPFAMVAAYSESSMWTQGGNHFWRLGYLAGLCLLAGLAACAHGSVGRLRRDLVRASLTVAGLTVLALALTVLTGPVGHWATWDPRWW